VLQCAAELKVSGDGVSQIQRWEALS